MKKVFLLFALILLYSYSFSQDPVTVINPNNSSANVSLNWHNNVARIRIGGEGLGATNGLDIQGPGNKSLLRLYDNGNVGVGLSPLYKFDVNGYTRTKRLYLYSGGGIYSLYNDNFILNDHSNGNVTLSAAGGNLYLGYANTNRILLRQGLYSHGGTQQILHSDGYIYQTMAGVNNYFAGKIGIGNNSPVAMVEINNPYSGGTPGFVLNNTWKENSSDFTKNSPFIIRRHNSNNEALASFVQDGRAHFVYQNDEYASGIEFRLINTDIENSDGSRSSDRTVMTISSGQNYGQVKVDGKVLAEEVEVKLIASNDIELNGTLTANNITYTANGNTADFVFEDSYHLKDLSEVETFIKANKHLPEVPSADEMEEAGVNLAEMNKLLLMKVEELTLYSIEQEKKIEELSEDRKRVAEVESALNKAYNALKEEAERRHSLEERLNQMEEILTNLNKQ